MSAVVAEIVPRDIIHPDTVGLYPLMFTGTIENSADRMQVVADQVGIPLLITDSLEQKRRMIFDMKARDAHRPGPNFADASKRRVEEMLPKLDGFKNRVGIGHSLGSVVITGMQRYGEAKPFSIVELCDGFNVSRLGYIGFSLYQARDAVRARIMNHRQSVPPIRRHDWSEYHDGHNETSILRKMYNLGELMGGAESEAGALALAGDADLPLHVIGLTHGLSGSHRRHLMPFKAEIENARARAVQQSNPDKPPVPFVFTVEDLWHSDILKPSVIAPNLARTLAMLTAG